MPDPSAGTAPDPFLSLVVMTRNEAHNVPDLLTNLEGVDEVVIADMESDDGTVELAEARGARVLRLPNAGFAEPGRMDAIRFSRGEWILMLDADERLPAGGVDAVRELCAQTPGTVSAYRLPRTNYLGGRPIRGSGWGPEAERHARLFRREGVRWAPRVHSRAEFDGTVLDLPDGGVIRIEHDNFRDYRHFLDKLNDYSSLEADDLVAAGGRPTLAMALRFALEELVARYDPEHDGPFSLPLAIAMFGYRFTCHAKASEALDWDDDPVISREALVGAAQSFWSALRLRELRRAEARLAGDEDEVAVAAAERALAVWGEMPPQLLQVGATTDDGATYELPLEQLAGDVTSGDVHRSLEEVRLRVELRQERRARQAAGAARADAEVERNQAVEHLDRVAAALRDALERVAMMEQVVADAQAREAAAQLALRSPSPTASDDDGPSSTTPPVAAALRRAQRAVRGR
jgi:glycosyltransferase involved in cell wall biosynthesis